MQLATSTRQIASAPPARAADQYAAAVRSDAPARSDTARAVDPVDWSHPAAPPTPPMTRKVRTPAKRGCAPVDPCPDRSRSIPTANPTRAAIARRMMSDCVMTSG